MGLELGLRQILHTHLAIPRKSLPSLSPFFVSLQEAAKPHVAFDS
jgi:hypothetical protein